MCPLWLFPEPQPEIFLPWINLYYWSARYGFVLFWAVLQRAPGPCTCWAGILLLSYTSRLFHFLKREQVSDQLLGQSIARMNNSYLWHYSMDNYGARIYIALTCSMTSIYHYTLSECLDVQHREKWSLKTVQGNCYQLLRSLCRN